MRPRKNLLLITSLLGLMACDAPQLYSQGFGRGERGDFGGGRGGSRGDFGGGFGGRGGFSSGDIGERMFGRMDRNENGRLDPDEIQGMPSTMRDMLENADLDTSRAISREDFVREIPSVMEGLRSRGGFGGRGDSGFGRGGDRSSSGFSRNRTGRGEDGRRSSTEKKKQEIPRVTIDLPATFGSYDKNSDGQIGLYEWERARFAEFFKLDQNGDGFLTPREIVNVNQLSVAASSSSLSPSTPSSFGATGSSSRSRFSSRRSSGSSDSNRSGSSGTPAAPPSEARIRLTFRLLDGDKDGSLTSEEWQRSRSTRQSFERAKVELPMPATADQFVAAYSKLSQVSSQ